MARKMKTDLVSEVIRRIGESERKLSWAGVVALFAERGVVVTRQWLSRNGEIVAAYKRRRSEGTRAATSGADPSNAADHRMQVLTERLAAAEDHLRRYDLAFVQLLRAARAADVGLADLDLPPWGRSARGDDTGRPA